ncbi:reverse transcriptase family protein [Clostridium beijerinckii]|uniref:Reverse transcriptase domain-containing protein n=1 Tax=Clostridium beijerinckii TaxID=1520 RepID=A0A1S9N9H7_CLOBE|nr:reverse transcriptase family protein [Clostridium beijerinckii]OOP74115.1 hypothetical protein CBEIBR21_06350 [Clostridium beijerinckii]
MNNEINQYKLEDSLLYRLRNRGKLAEMFNLPHNYFRTQYKLDIEYKSKHIKTGRNKKDRLVENPNEKLKNIQRKILKYLSRIQTPDWIISGKKGKSYIDNSKFHKDNSYVITSDIMNFYPSCKRDYVYRMFRYTFRMPSDLAIILTTLVTYNGGIPTGAPTSQMIAYWAYRDTFIRMNEIALEYNTKFSLYVDDMVFSSKSTISKRMILEIKKELQKCGMNLKDNKTRKYGGKDYKLITGVVYDKNGVLKIPNRLRKDIIDGYNEIKKMKDTCSETDKKSLLGKIYSARQIEPDAFSQLLQNVKKIKCK